MAKLNRFLVLGALAAFGILPSAMAERMDCTAQVTIHPYKVSLDTQTRHLSILTDGGSRFDGEAGHYYSPRARSDSYFLATGFGTGLMVELEQGGAQRVALCLATNECYLCRRD